jgi:hypothetical protein
MAQGVIHLSQRTITAVYVCDDLPGDVSRRCRRKCFNAVADDENDVCLECCVSTRQFADRSTGFNRSGFGRRVACIPADDSGNRQTCRFDVFN